MTTGSEFDVRERANAWLKNDPDEATRLELQQILDRNEQTQLDDRFGSRLEFGTAGLRGVLGAGSNRMNRVVVIETTAGLCSFLLATVPDARTRGVVIGYDGRRMSRRFAEDTAEVCAGYGIIAHLFNDTVPTPLLAFAVLHLGAAAGVMVTASHNPPEYNGFKVYAGNGAQIVPPIDVEIANSIANVGEFVKIARPILKEARAKGLVVDAPVSIEETYLASVRALTIHHLDAPDFSIVYTPLHGVGNKLTRAALDGAGFTHVTSVPEQAEPDGAFPTVAFPNPEEKGAMDLALALAKHTNADLVIANDPDADRLAIATRDEKDQWVQLSGNEVGALFGYYLLVDDPKPASDRLVVTTVVSSPLLGWMAKALGVRYEETLTGFKWITNRAIEVERESGTRFVFGYEEALGYTIGTLVRDKDGVSAAAVFAELARYYRVQHKREVLQQLEHIYRRFGLFASAQHNVTFRGAEGAIQIKRLMNGFRANVPGNIGDISVHTVSDLQDGTRTTLADGVIEKLTLPSSNVIAYALADGSRITLRPSGTEPKIKYYFDVREVVIDGEPMADTRARANAKMQILMKAFVAMADQRGQAK